MHDQLRSHIERSSKHEIKPCLLVEFLSKAKISNLNIEIIGVVRDQQDVLWFHISMSDRLQMHVVQAQHDLVDDVHCLALCKAAHLGEALEELTTFY